MIPPPTIPPLSTVLATLPEFPTLRESLGFQATGLMVVFIALGLIWGLMEITGAFFRRRDGAAARVAKARPASPAAASATVSAVPPADAPVDPATLAVIMAAVHCVLGAAPHRIMSVTPAGDAPLDWSREGRREHFSSHRLR